MTVGGGLLRAAASESDESRVLESRGTGGNRRVDQNLTPCDRPGAGPGDRATSSSRRPRAIQVGQLESESPEGTGLAGGPAAARTGLGPGSESESELESKSRAGRRGARRETSP
jgi:hypothetical protein